MNKYQEALDNVKDDRVDIIDMSADGYIPYTTLDNIEALQELVDRATPMKVIGFQDDIDELFGDWHLCCPSCHKIAYNRNAYCPNCGQALDWSELNEKRPIY